MYTYIHTLNDRQLEKQLHEVQQSRAQLIAELGNYQSQVASHTTQQESLERENDLLREQLKKYVGMVQIIRRESSAKTTESVVQGVLSAGELSNVNEYLCVR